MDNLSINATPEERKQAVYWFSVVFTHLSGMLRPATYCTGNFVRIYSGSPIEVICSTVKRVVVAKKAQETKKII
jgi:hypothetical protein